MARLITECDGCGKGCTEIRDMNATWDRVGKKRDLCSACYGPPGETHDRLRAEGAVYCGVHGTRPLWSHEEPAVRARAAGLGGNFYMAPPKLIAHMRAFGLLPQVPGKAAGEEADAAAAVDETPAAEPAYQAADPEPSRADIANVFTPITRAIAGDPPEQPTYPGLTYVGTAYGCRVYVGERDEWRSVEDFPIRWFIGERCGPSSGEASHLRAGFHKRALVTPAVLAVLDGWVEWSERICAECGCSDFVGLAAGGCACLRCTEKAKAEPWGGAVLTPPAEPYEPQLLWGKPQIPDDRSTDLLEVVDGRVVLHLEESETHTGLLEHGARSEQHVDALRAISRGGGVWSEAVSEECRVVAESLDTIGDGWRRRGWPVDLTAIRDAAERLNLALSWKANGTRPAEQYERRGSANCEHGELAAYEARLKAEAAREKHRLFIPTTRKASPWAPYEGE